MPTHKLDNYLRTHRRRSGYSQEHLAYLLGAGDGAKVSHYEQHGRRPAFDTLLAYAAIFGVPTEELFSGRFAQIRTGVRRRAAVLRRRLAASPQTPAALHELESLSKISKPAA